MGVLSDGRGNTLYCRGIVRSRLTPHDEPLLSPQIHLTASYIESMDLMFLHLETVQRALGHHHPALVLAWGIGRKDTESGRFLRVNPICHLHSLKHSQVNIHLIQPTQGGPQYPILPIVDIIVS